MFLRLAIARWQTRHTQCPMSARSDPLHCEAMGWGKRWCEVPAAGLWGGKISASDCWRAPLSVTRRFAGALGRQRDRKGGRLRSARPVLCSLRRPRCPLTCSDRLGGAAACGAKAVRVVCKEIIYPRVLFVVFVLHGQCFRYYSGETFALSGGGRPRFWAVSDDP